MSLPRTSQTQGSSKPRSSTANNMPPALPLLKSSTQLYFEKVETWKPSQASSSTKKDQSPTAALPPKMSKPQSSLSKGLGSDSEETGQVFPPQISKLQGSSSKRPNTAPSRTTSKSQAPASKKLNTALSWTTSKARSSTSKLSPASQLETSEAQISTLRNPLKPQRSTKMPGPAPAPTNSKAQSASSRQSGPTSLPQTSKSQSSFDSAELYFQAKSCSTGDIKS